MHRRLVTAFNGARDYYELPLALHEMGLLERHVTDLYCPQLLAGLPGIPDRMRRRRRAGLPGSRIHVDLGVALRAHLWPAPAGRDPFYDTDRRLSLAAATVARETDSDLFLHSQYAYWAFQALPDRKRYLYQYHPNAASTRALLQQDFAAHPEVRWSFENEQDSQPLERQRAEALQEWTMADGIICASSFTKDSLVRQGCRADIIRVVPYGVFPSPRTVGNPDTRQARFLFVGQGVQRKGLHHLLKAWKFAALKHSELIVVARKLDPGLRHLLDQPNVRYQAGVSPETLAEYYRSASVFVMPSLVEGFGLVYLEALAAGLHCIGTPNTGLPDLKLPADCATLVTAGDVSGLTAVLSSVAERHARGEISSEAISSRVAPLTWAMRRAELRAAIDRMVA